MTERTNLAERVTGAMFWNSILLPVKTLLTFVASVVIVRSLSQGDYAVFTSLVAVLNTIGLWSDLGIEGTISKYIPEVDQRFGRGGLTGFLGGLLAFKFSLLAVVLAGLALFWDRVAADLGLGPDPWPYFPVIVVLLSLGIFSDFILQFLHAYFDQRARNALDIIYALVNPLLILLFIWAGWGVLGILYARALATLFYVLAGWRFSLRILREVPALVARRGNWASTVARFARLSGVTYSGSLLLYFSDMPFAIFVLTYFGDTLGVALFGFAFGRVVSPILQFLVSSLYGVNVPMFARVYLQNDLRKLQEAYASLCRFLMLMLVPSAVGLILLAPNLIRLFFQSRYEPAAPVVVALVATFFAESMFQAGVQVLIAFEQNRLALTARLITLFSIPLLFIYVPALGPAGAALAIGLPRVLSRLFAALVVQRKFGLSYPSRFLYKVGLASALMALPMLLALGLQRPHDITETALRSVLAFALGAATFLIAFKRLGSIESQDRARLASLRIPFKRIVLSWL